MPKIPIQPTCSAFPTMAEDPNEDSWLYGGPPNAEQGGPMEDGLQQHTEEESLAEALQKAPNTADCENNEEDDGFKEDEEFQKLTNPTDDDPFEDEVSGSLTGKCEVSF